MSVVHLQRGTSRSKHDHELRSLAGGVHAPRDERDMNRPALAAHLDRLGVPQLVMSLRRKAPLWLTILTYHRVARPDATSVLDDGVVDVTPELLERQLAFVGRWFQPVRMDDLLAFVQGRGELPNNPVLVTFDDGYRDNHDVALPILMHRGIRATFFIATDYVEQRRLFWWDRVAMAIKRSLRDRIEIDYPRPTALPLEDGAQRQTAVRRAQRIIKDTPGLDLDCFIDQLERAAGVVLGRDEERSMADETLMTHAHAPGAAYARCRAACDRAARIAQSDRGRARRAGACDFVSRRKAGDAAYPAGRPRSRLRTRILERNWREPGAGVRPSGCPARLDGPGARRPLLPHGPRTSMDGVLKVLRTRVVVDVSELERLVPEWRRLLQRAAHAQPVLTPLWLLAWWREFGEADGRSMRAVAIEDGSELVGLVPLAWRRTVHRVAIPVRRLELFATGETETDEICSEYVGALVARGKEDDVARATSRAICDGVLGEWDELSMTAMSAEDPLVPRLVGALRADGIAAHTEQSGECPYVPLPRNWAEYLSALGSARRYVVSRSVRELDKWVGASNWEMCRARTPAELLEGKRVLRKLHAERWAASGRSGVFASARFARFHDEVMPRLLAGEDGISLELQWLQARGEPIAAMYNFVYAGKVYFYQSGRRVDVPRGVRPGIAMHAIAIRASIEAGRREYDFLGGASRYKRDLALAIRPLVTLRAVAPSLRARAVDAARALAERAIARVRAARVAEAEQAVE
jgi:peptidoglycan/xylan/chitin deacetylase (PgdA/CDA1 family)/CelD/BcsL family acetyltransferase involved in cellulose biosynthesis